MVTLKPPSPKHKLASLSAPNAPSKTPSTKDTSSSFIYYTPKSPRSSTSPSTNGYLNSPTSPPPPPPTQENTSMDITLTLSPITPLDVQFNTPSPFSPFEKRSCEVKISSKAKRSRKVKQSLKRTLEFGARRVEYGEEAASLDPFNIYPLLHKKHVETSNNGSENSIPFPPGFTPVDDYPKADDQADHCLFSSSLWNSIVRDVRVLKNRGVDLVSYCVKRVGNGLHTGFWEECWIGDKSLSSMFPRIFAFENNKSCLVSDKLSDGLIRSLRRPMRGGVESQQLSLLNDLVSSVSLSNSEDRWVWN
nr:hypothetical protein [Tanacetum cinerariifolium]